MVFLLAAVSTVGAPAAPVPVVAGELVSVFTTVLCVADGLAFVYLPCSSFSFASSDSELFKSQNFTILELRLNVASRE